MRWEEEKNKFPGFSLSLHQTSNFHNRSKPQDCFCTKSLNQKLENQKMSFLIHHFKITSPWISTLSSKPEHMLFQSPGMGLFLSEPEKFLFRSIASQLLKTNKKKAHSWNAADANTQTRSTWGAQRGVPGNASVDCPADARVFVHTQGARCSGLGSFAVPAPAAGHQRQTRPADFARRWPHPHRQPETRARKLSLPEGGILPGRSSLLHGPERAKHPQRRYGQR